MEMNERIDSRYKVIRLIGTGGMANVYLARDLILDRDVAIKVMRYDFRDDQDSIRRFNREALATTELAHTNVVNIFEVGEDASNPYIVMEYVKGTDLKQYIKNYYPIPYKKTIDIMDEVLAGVSYAHQQGIIHRDLKPQNILIDENDNVKISDFGIAVALSQNSITQTNSLLGSVHYISPEQARGSMASKQSDIYSLGIILYEMLTGVVPFDGESAVSIALKHFQHTFPSLREFDARIPQPLENVVLKATAKEMKYRYQSVEEMRADLRTVLDPNRRDEAKFLEPVEDTDETKVIPVISGAGETSVQANDTVDGKAKKGAQTTKKTKKKPLGILIGLLVLAIGAFVFFLLTSPQEVKVPDLAGMTEEEAQMKLEDLNLVLGETHQESNEEVEEGLVIRSTPNEGSTVREQQSIDLFVSTGKSTIEFEDYQNEAYEEIRARLTEAGFTVRKEEDYSTDVDENHIISQSIEAGEEVVPSETTVTFTVSIGEEGFPLSDLQGYSLRGVQEYMDNNNLNLFVRETHSDEIPEGQVISQSPDAGTNVYSNDSVTVVISLGPEDSQISVFTRNVTIPYQAPEDADTGDTPAANQVQIYLDDSAHSIDSVYRQITITEDTDIEIPFILETGKAGSYRIERDGEVIEEEANITE